jgi:hypothetical protein
MRHLAQRLMEYQAESKARLDGQWRIDRLAAPLSGGRRLPCTTIATKDRLDLVFDLLETSAPGHGELQVINASPVDLDQCDTRDPELATSLNMVRVPISRSTD